MMNRKSIAVTPEKALFRLETLCSKGEHSEGELREKLRKWNVCGGDADKIIRSLKANRYLDDARFARAFVHDKVEFAAWGRRKVRMALLAKRVDADVVEEALAETDADKYLENAVALVLRKMKGNHEDAESYEGRTKIFRFLLSRGYESDIAAKALKHALQRDNEL